MHNGEIMFREPNIPSERLKRQAESAAGNASQVTVIEVFGGITRYQDYRSTINVDLALMAAILNCAKHGPNWRTELQGAFQGTPEQIDRLTGAADLYGQAISDGLTPRELEIFAKGRGYYIGDIEYDPQGATLVLSQYSRSWDAENDISESGGPQFST